jgi:uncharacterized repeat protein (TIGR03803 family)
MGIVTRVPVFQASSDSTDGKFPEGSLISEDGELFGTTSVGGIVNGEPQYGTVFELDPQTQSLTTLHVFTGADGESPVAGMVYRKDKLFGTTESGGTDCASGCGTVFELDVAAGALTTLHAFTGTDGSDPKDTLVYKKGKLYGTTLGGGTGCTNNCGTVFELEIATGTPTTLHDFTGGDDGEQPWGNLIYEKGVFYGTTVLGAEGYGTVFEITP